MKAADPVLIDYLAQLESLRPGLPGADHSWLLRERAEAEQRLRQDGLPDRHHEDWRYTDVSALHGQRLDSSGEAASVPVQLPPPLSAASWRLVFIDGYWSAAASQLDGLPEGIRCGSLASACAGGWAAPWSVASAAAGEGRGFRDLCLASAADGLWLELPDGLKLDRPLECLFVSTGRRAAQVRSRIRLGTGAALQLVEHHLGLDAQSYWVNHACDIDLQPGSTLRHIRWQQESSQGLHLADLQVNQQAESRYDALLLTTAGRLCRTDLCVLLRGVGAQTKLNGLYIAGGQAYADFHTRLEHQLGGCHSEELFRGILHGASRAVFDGLIEVFPLAQQTDAHLLNHNLLLSREAEVNTKPQLVINADDVKCSHGTTVGQLDDNMLFYLRSRGIPEAEARNMLCHAFAESALDGRESSPLRDAIREGIDRALASIIQA